MMTAKTYKMSFTSGGLFFNESIIIAELYDILHECSGDCWQQTRKKILSENLLQSRTASSAKRRAREICSRLQLLTDIQRQLLISGSRQEQQYLLWVAVCKCYSFIKEFMVEVVREKFLRMDYNLQPQDYEIFFASRAEWYEELEQLKKSTQTRLRQALFQIMREAEIISPDNIILPGLLTEQLIKVIAMDDPLLLAVFPVSDMDLKKVFSVQLSVPDP